MPSRQNPSPCATLKGPSAAARDETLSRPSMWVFFSSPGYRICGLNQLHAERSGMPIVIGDFKVAEHVVEWIEIAAIAAIAASVVIAIIAGIHQILQREGGQPLQAFKRAISGGLMIGLDLLIASDIIKSVTIEPTLSNIAGVGLLVLIRTFLSWTLIVEAEGRWPWQEPDPEVARE
jgi:uncharacterized membrane protein